MIKIKIFIILIFVISSYDIFSQTQLDQFDCGSTTSSEANDSIGNPFRGYLKPNRTDLSGGNPAPPDAYFPVLVVFVQFKDETDDPRDTSQSNKKPTYLGKMIATRKDTTGDWWNWYDSETEILSSQWAEISRGKFHVISPVPDTVTKGAFSVVLSKTGQEYFEFYNYNKLKTDSSIRREIWDSIRAQGLIDWRPYDRWKKIENLFYFSELGQGDSLVDMIYQVFKTRGGANVIDSLGIPSTLFLSPYSSPNTNTWANQNSGIFIWHYLYSGSGPTGVAY